MVDPARRLDRGIGYRIGQFYTLHPQHSIEVGDQMDHSNERPAGVTATCRVPNPDFGVAWDAIKIDQAVRNRLVANALISLQLRQNFSFEMMPLHGLVVLAGPPGTGKTTLARGLANAVAENVRGHVQFLEVDPHALASSSLGRSQKEVTKLFQQVIPEHSARGPCIVLLDEVETLAADRQRLSLEANPIDVHRSTDATLAGLDFLARNHRSTLLIATTNFPEAVDRAFLSRADWVETIGMPNPEARGKIIGEVIAQLATKWPRIGELQRHVPSFVIESDGLDGRQLRKAILAACASSVDVAMDPNKLRREHVVATFELARQARDGMGRCP